MSFKLTPAAERFIRLMLQADGAPGSGFRMVVSLSGCSGLSADISVKSAPEAGDAVVDGNGFKLFLPTETRVLLDGVTIDFADSAAQTGLVFQSPRPSTCSSHSADHVH
jgi:iron-sulfur cluster assembly accessory protein